MISYSRDHQFSLHNQSVKIIGLGGAGINILHRVTQESLDSASILAIDSDSRLLKGSDRVETLQLGKNRTKGLGAGGDPDLGLQATQETEDEIRAAVKGYNLVFICVGLGGGIGSGALPLICRVAREEGAFVVVFATTPFRLEGKRRQNQAQTTLNELNVLANALVIFDNNRMGELIVDQKGIHEAFSAADVMISQSIKSVIRLILCPGLINIGLDDLISALRTKQSRCLFGAGFAEGKDRALRALNTALSSPLLDQGSLLNNADTVIVHISGGKDLTLTEVETLMKELEKYIPETAHVLFGAAVDESAPNCINVTLISALPEDELQNHKTTSILPQNIDTTALEPTDSFAAEVSPVAKTTPTIVATEKKQPVAEVVATPAPSEPTPAEPVKEISPEPKAEKVEKQIANEPETIDPIVEPEPTLDIKTTKAPEEAPKETPVKAEKITKSPEPEKSPEPTEIASPQPDLTLAEEPAPEEEEEEEEDGTPPWLENPGSWGRPTTTSSSPAPTPTKPIAKEEPDLFGGSSKTETKGRFEGNPTIIDGEDLDTPAFLRKSRSK